MNEPDASCYQPVRRAPPRWMADLDEAEIAVLGRVHRLMRQIEGSSKVIEIRSRASTAQGRQAPESWLLFVVHRQLQPLDILGTT